MKAAVYIKYGPPEVVQIVEMPKPVAKPNQVLVKIHATSVNTSDWRMRSATFPAGFGFLARLGLGITGPRNQVLGAALAGVVEGVGDNVTTFSKGDRVFAGGGFGGHAEYKAVKENQLATIPAGMSFEAAACLSFGGATAMYFLHEKGNIKAGDNVLINGASGSTGIAAVQLAKIAGSTVWAVCSGKNAELVRTHGADHVVDYTMQDFTKLDQKFDIIFDSVGNAPWSRVKHVLTDKGRLLIVLGGLWAMVSAPFVSRKNGKKAISGTPPESGARLKKLAELVRAGDYEPIIDRTYPFEQIVEAHQYVDTGRKRGNVAITVVPAATP